MLVVVGGFGWFWLVPCFSNYKYHKPTAEEVNNLEYEQGVLRQKALNASNETAEKMVKRELRHQPDPSFILKNSLCFSESLYQINLLNERKPR